MPSSDFVQRRCRCVQGRQLPVLIFASIVKPSLCHDIFHSADGQEEGGRGGDASSRVLKLSVIELSENNDRVLLSTSTRHCSVVYPRSMTDPGMRVKNQIFANRQFFNFQQVRVSKAYKYSKTKSSPAYSPIQLWPNWRIATDLDRTLATYDTPREGMTLPSSEKNRLRANTVNALD